MSLAPPLFHADQGGPQVIQCNRPGFQLMKRKRAQCGIKSMPAFVGAIFPGESGFSWHKMLSVPKALLAKSRHCYGALLFKVEN